MKIIIISFALCFIFLNTKKANAQTSAPPIEKDSILTILEMNPEFPNGNGGLNRFIILNVKYPKSTRIAGYHGKAYLHFVVNSNGKAEFDYCDLSNMYFAKKKVTEDEKDLAIKGIENSLKQLIEKMPLWKPGYQGPIELNKSFRESNYTVKSKLTLPIVF